MTTILSLDGATRTCGISLLSQDGGPIQLQQARNICIDEELSIPARLVYFKDRYLEIIDELKPDLIAIEDLKFNHGAPNFSSLTKVAMIIGVAVETARRYNGRDPILITASTVRSAIGNTAKKNKKAETRRIVNAHFRENLTLLKMYPLKGNQEDISDSIALGWAAFARIQNEAR